MDDPERREPASPPPPVRHPFQPADPDEPAGLVERLRALAGDGEWFHRAPILRIVLALALALAAWRFLNSSFREVHPGTAGIASNRFTGSVRVLPPGTHFLPRTLYGLVPVRVSDQLLAGADATFNVSTREGLSVGVTLQARWAVDGAQLLARWAALPADPAREVVSPVLASAFRSVAPAYDATAILSEKREELAAKAGQLARARLLESGIVLKEVLVGDLKLPAEYEKARLALLDELQNAERKTATLKLKEKEIEQSRLEAQAEMVRKEKAAETEASQKLIAAKGERDAMDYILPRKEKEIRAQELEAEAEKAKKLKNAQADAEAGKIQTEAEALRRRTLADAEAYAIRTTSIAQFENLKREVELIQANPIWVSKTFAEKISDKVQVILTPQLSSNVFTDEVLKRVANGKPAVPRPVEQTSAPVQEGAQPACEGCEDTAAPTSTR